MGAPRELELSDEVEGDQDGTTDFVFRLAGDPIPLLPTASSPLPLFDLLSPPARPLAVSDRHATVFLAHPNGFMAVRTKELIEASKEARDKGKASTRCAQDCCVVDVPLPGVSLLALSRDESELAACTDNEIQFFSLASLLTNKDVEPSSSCSLGQAGTVKDFKWLKNASAAYVVLSDSGLLSHGNLGGGLKDVMENVDAVDCCKEGNHIAVARENKLTILSSDFKETCCMSLLFQLWSDESDSEGTAIKVDSIGWVRDDSIVIGCVRLNEEGNEEGYLVQVIRSEESTFFEDPSKAVVYSYVDFFHGIMDDILPSGVGPNLLLGYLHRWDLMLASNKKSIDEHIALLKWSSTQDDEKTVTYLEMLEDKYSPRIDLQENGDDNVILGFGVENVSLFQKITVTVGPEQKEVAPQHILLCLTGEGKVVIYYLARISDPSDLPHSTAIEERSPATVTEKELTPSVKSSVSQNILTEHDAEPSSAQTGSDQQESIDLNNNSVSKSQETTGSSLFIASDKKPLNTKQVDVVTPIATTPSLGLTGSSKPGMSFSFSTPNKLGTDPTGSREPTGLAPSLQTSSSSSSSFIHSQTAKGGLGSAQSVGTFGGPQNSNKDGGALTLKSPLFPSSASVPAKIGERNEAGLGNHLPQTSYTTDRKVFGPSVSLGTESSPSIASAKPFPLGSFSSGFRTVISESSQSLGGSPPSQQPMAKPQNSRTQTSVDYSRSYHMGTIFDSEQDLPKKFYSINEMTKELDTLLAYIEKDGGFRDACITFQQHPLSTFEDGLQNFTELLRVFKSKVEGQCSKIEDLRNKMFQVSARQGYMKGIVSQSSDTQYWDIWNRQKLSPEFEVKRQNILKANQNLTSQLVELERHFNNLEMNKFGETGRVASGRRAVFSNKSRSSQTQLSSVYNALNSQLAAAEQLSECLSKQISTLNIGSPTTKRGAVTKELFESIGLAHTTDTTKFLGGTPSKSIKRFPPVHEHSKGILGPSKNAEPETARRRRESLDMSLASLEPQKTTVKRMAQQQRLKISSDLPFRSNKKIFDSQMAAISQEKSSGSSNASIVESYASRLRSPSEVASEVKAKPSGPQQNSLFKWAKESTGPSQSSEQKNFELPGQMKSASQSSKLAPSPTSFSFTHKGAQDSTSPSNVTSFGTTHSVPKSNTLTFKTTIAPKSNANTEPNIFTSMATSKTSLSPLSVKTLPGESGDASTLTVKNRQDNQAMPSLGNTKGSGASPQNKSDTFRDLSKSSFTSELSKSAVLNEKTGQLSGVSYAVQNTVKDTPKMAPQTPALSSGPITPTSSFSIKPAVSSSATSTSPAMQESSANVLDVLSPTISSMQKATPKVSPVLPGVTVSSSVPSVPTPVKDLSTGLYKDASKPEVPISGVTSTSASASMTPTISTAESKSSFAQTVGASLPSTPVSDTKLAPVTAESVVSSTGKDLGPSNLSTDEDDMEEEAPPASADLSLGALGGFSLGSQPSSSPQKSNPFGSSFSASDNTSSGTPFTLTTSPGQLFRPASLSIPSAQPAPSQSTSSSAFSSTFSSGLPGFGQPAQIGPVQQSGFGKPALIGSGQPAGFGQPAQIQSGFGQPAHIGSGQQPGFGQPAQFGAQQALGSVLGSFGQSRQLGGSGGFGGFASADTSAGFASLSSSNAGFAGASAGGGFSAPVSSAGGGFAAAAGGGGGFAALATKSGGFAAAASSGAGFAAPAASAGGFGGATQGGGFGGGGFGAFGSNQGAGFSAFGASGPGRPPADFLTQMRK